MEGKISHLIQGISMLSRKTVPPTLNKHLTNVSFCIYLKIPLFIYLLNVNYILENI